MNARISQDQFDRIYLEDVIPALEYDPELSFLPKDASNKYLNKGVCPGCGERTLYISKEKPFQLKCNRLSLPKLPKGDQVWQHSEASQQRVEANGDWTRQTDGRIRDKSTERTVESLTNAEQYQSDSRTVDDHSTESVGGIKTIEAMGALKLLTAGAASLAAIDDLSLSTGRDLNQVVAQKLNLAVGGQLLERIQGARRSIAPTTWLGSESVNVLQVLCDLIDLVQQLAAQLASHTHVPGPAPSSSDATQFTTKAASAALLAEKLKPITA